MRLINAQLILEDRIVAGSVQTAGGRIAKVTAGKAAAGASGKSAANTIDLKGGYLAPGFVDLHIHGALGRDTMEASVDAFRAITEFHLRGGTTSIALTTVTAAEQEILAVLEAAKPLRNQSLGGSRIAGIHVEG